MISVDAAAARIAAAFSSLPPESVPIERALGRVLLEDVRAREDQPPAPMSAMDGYAVRANDAKVSAKLSVIGAAPAGQPFGGHVGPGETVRIFTGGVVPEGADAVVLQEDVTATGNTILVKEAPQRTENVRPRGLDFRAGDVLLARGRRLTPRDIALIAAADIARVKVTKKPRIAIVATGDELSRPGTSRKPGGIAASSTYAVQAMVEKWGGEAVDVGILPDRPEAFAELPEKTKDADLIVTLGGASVGDHDLIQSALAPHGFALDFWKIAMRPGKPLIFGRLKQTPLLGLPGNPVSAMVCTILFLAPALASMLGASYQAPIAHARVSENLRANGKRQDYLRAKLTREGGTLIATPFTLQDSSMQKVFAEANGLILRPVDAPAVNAGGEVPVLLLDDC
jgi:molybdopterin molybdotransferase